MKMKNPTVQTQAQAILGDMGEGKEGLGSIMNMAKKLAGGAPAQ